MFPVCLVLICAFLSGYAHEHPIKFPKNFEWGLATSAYQIEGAWNQYGKGLNIWDNFTHRVPSPIFQNDTGDIACDSYHRYKEDVRNVFITGSQFYRFSISWARVLPTGYTNKPNEAGIAYYKNLIKEILRYNMTPVVTIYHWDLPQHLYEQGIHWTSPKLVDVFVDYARFIISRYPEVGRWTTINEPKQICHFGYGLGNMAPGIKSDGVLEYQCAYILLKVHAATYRMYKKEFPHYKAKMSIVIDCPWSEPLTNSKLDIEAAERQKQFECGLYLHPIFVGDWPKIVIDRVAERSRVQKLPRSRLPSFTREEIDFIKGTHDYIGLNQYYTYLVENIAGAGDVNNEFDNYENDVGVVYSTSPHWRLGANLWAMVPTGIRRTLIWMKNQYNNPEILITEMGLADNGNSLVDDDRIDYIREYSCNILDAIYIDKVNVKGATYWSLMDNFEWTAGYQYHFGLYHIDFKNDRALKRVPKKSFGFFQQMVTSREVYCNKPGRRWKWIKIHKRQHHHIFK